MILLALLLPLILRAQEAAFPGTVRINDHLFMDKQEITNLDWKEYLSWIEKRGEGKNSSAYLGALPDTSVWEEEALRERYFQHPAYHDYPVVGVSHEQAEAYCRWRTRRVKEVFDLNNQEKPGKAFSGAFRYRLPRSVEWELIGRRGFDREALRKKLEKNDFNRVSEAFNVRKMGPVPGQQSHSGPGPRPDRSFFPNTFDIYGMIGNVAEMVAEPGIAKGGSWYHPWEEQILSKDYPYEEPQPWLGFRCICEILDR